MSFPLKPAQCRAARGLLDWTQQKLSEEANVSVVTIRDFEKGRDTRDGTRFLILSALRGNGVEISEDEERLSVHLKRSS